MTHRSMTMNPLPGAVLAFLLSVGILITNSAHAQTSAVCFSWNGLKFMSVPQGDFRMGANDVSDAVSGFEKDQSNLKRSNKNFKDELPQHQFSVKHFCLMNDSLTKAQATRLLKESALPKNYLSEPDDDVHESTNPETSSEPIRLTWDKAVVFARVLSKRLGKVVRLPSEAEWEYAARGGLPEKQFPWGNVGETFKGLEVRDIVLNARGNCKANAVAAMAQGSAVEKCVASAKAESEYVQLNEIACFSKILNQRVGNSPANNYGLVNLTNNEWEWTSSRYMPYPYKADDGRESPPTLKNEARVLRGGNNNNESCLGYTALRGHGRAGTDKRDRSSYAVRYAIED